MSRIALVLCMFGFTVHSGSGPLVLDRARAAPAHPGEVDLTLRLADGRQRFRPGEIVAVELQFSSAVSGRYVVDGATDDRSGRLTLDEFRIEPLDGITDPLLDYFAAQAGFIGGGLRSMGTLGSQPFTVRLELNAWFRFSHPGRYTLSVRSLRVTDESGREGGPAAVVPVESERIMFEILPADDAWESRTLAQAVSILDGPGLDTERRTGCRMLRFLGTEAAVEEMVRRFAEARWGCEFDFMAGLFGASNRAHAVGRLEEQLIAPDAPVTTSYLRTLAILSLYLRHPDLRLPQTREHIGRRVAGELGRRRDAIDAAMDHYTVVLIASLPRKAPRARALTLVNLLDGASADPNGRLASALRGEIAAVFLDLPEARQRMWLEHQWDREGGPAMLPALRALTTVPRSAPSPLFDLALRRLYELSPEEARPLILREIGNPGSGATIATLGLLPEGELPQFDGVLAARLESGEGQFDLMAELVERYASPSVAPRLLATLGPRVGVLACRPQMALLAYFLRAHPEAGQALLERALAARAATGCYREVLGGVARLRMSPALEALAITHLDDPVADVVANAAETLGRHGSPAALEPLRARFERWHDAWKGRHDELRFRYTAAGEHAAEAAIERALVLALGEGAAWKLDVHQLRALGTLCVTDGCRREVDRMVAVPSP